MRDTLVGDDDGQLYDEAADIIQADYYRKVDREELVDKASQGRPSSRWTTTSPHYF